MRIALLFNPKSGSAGRIDALRQALADTRATIADFPSNAPGDLGKHAVAAARQHFDLIAVAGGDGTIHEVVNALGPRFPRTPLAVLPLGTGNDLCRTLNVPLDPLAAVAALRRGRVRKLDVMAVEGGPMRYAVNAATGGFSGKVAADVTSDLKGFWGPLAYLRGAVGTVADPPTFRVTLTLDGRRTEVLDVLNVVVANGRTAAGGIEVAPLADPEDGKLDVIVVRAGGGTLDLSIVTARLLAGEYLDDEFVTHTAARHVVIEADRPMPFSIDGELAEGQRFAFTAVRHAVRVLAGPGYRHNLRTPGVGLARGGRLGRFAFRAMAATLDFLRRPSVGWKLALTTAVVFAAAFAWLARGVLAGEWDQFNQTVTAAVRGEPSPGMLTAATVVTEPGGALGTAVGVAAAVVVSLSSWRDRRLNALTVLVVIAGCVGIELVFKPYLAVPRPETADLETLTWRGTFGFPSGHTLRAVGLYGLLAVAALAGSHRMRWLAAAACGLVVVGVGWSRVYLGVHSPTDVLGAALAAGAWLSLVVAVRGWLRRGELP